VIDWFAVFGDSAIHGEFRLLAASNEVMQQQVTATRIVSL
jgi:hypothetical protein